MNDCIFCKIREKQIPATFVYEDTDVMVFPDVHPQKPIHWLIVPKQHIPEFILVEDAKMREKLFAIVQKMIHQSGLKEKGYKIMINGGGHQDVDHLHIHLLGPMN